MFKVLTTELQTINHKLQTHTAALVVELVDTQDLKSCGQQWPYRFKSDPGHKNERERERNNRELFLFFISTSLKAKSTSIGKFNSENWIEEDSEIRFRNTYISGAYASFPTIHSHSIPRNN